MLKNWWAGFGTWAVAGMSGLGAVAAEYWNSAPSVLQCAALFLGPLLVVDAVSSMWFTSYAARQASKLEAKRAAEGGVEPSPAMTEMLAELAKGRTWTTAATRMGITLCLLVLALAFDQLTGTKHNTVLWILLWADGGHARFALRRLTLIAQAEDIEVPIFPNDAWDSIGKGRQPEKRVNGQPHDADTAPAPELPQKGD